jgi:hypothetical protein
MGTINRVNELTREALNYGMIAEDDTDLFADAAYEMIEAGNLVEMGHLSDMDQAALIRDVM